MKLGAAQWPFKWEPPYDSALRQIADLGLRAVELVVWNESDLRQYYTDEKIKGLRNLADDLGLEIVEFVGTSAGLADPDPAKREEAIAYFGEVVRVASALGTGIINSIPPFPFSIPVPRLNDRAAVQEWRVDYPSGLDWDANWKDYVEASKLCVAMCEDANLRWALEPHPFRYVANTPSMQRLIEHVDSEALGCNLDPSHLFPVGETPHASVYQLGSRVFNCHISDNSGDSNAHFRPGKGKVDWRAFMRSLKDVGFDGTLSIELEDTIGAAHNPGRPSEAAKGGPDASPEFLVENRIGLRYLAEAARQEGIELEGAPHVDDNRYQTARA